MKHLAQSILGCLTSILPFFSQKSRKEVDEFTALIMPQFKFLLAHLEKAMADYLNLSVRVREMHEELLRLREDLACALKDRCVLTDCKMRLKEVQ